MTRSMLRKLLTRTLVLFLVTCAVLIIMNFMTNRRLESQRQEEYRATFGSVLVAEEYRQVSVSAYKDSYPMIESLYTAYDATGKLSGYIVHAKMSTEEGDVLTRMSFSPDATTLIALQVLSNNSSHTDNGIYSDDFGVQFNGIRLPIALLADLPDENSPAKEYPPISGLHDGTFRAELGEADEEGYRDFVIIVVQGGRITEVTWDAVQTDGGNNRAKASVDGEYVLADNSIIWAEQAYAMQNRLAEVQDPAKIAIKSDGTTEVVPNVSVTVNAFIKLANQCVEESKTGLSATPQVTGTEEPTPAEASVTPDPSESTAAIETMSTETTGATEATVTSGDDTTESSGDFTGNEDGVVEKNQSSILSDTIDGFAVTEIKTRVNGAEGLEGSSRAIVSSVNQSYSFILYFLKGGE